MLTNLARTARPTNGRMSNYRRVYIPECIFLGGYVPKTMPERDGLCIPLQRFDVADFFNFQMAVLIFEQTDCAIFG